MIENYYYSRDLAPRQISSCTPRCTWGNPSRTSAATAVSPSPTAPTSPNTWGSTLASSPTDVKYVNASSPSSHISSSTSGLTRETSPTSAGMQVCRKIYFSIFCSHDFTLFQAAPRRSPSCPTCSPTPGVTRLTSPTSVTHATNVSTTSRPC